VLQKDLTGSGSFMGMIRVMHVLKLTRAAEFRVCLRALESKNDFSKAMSGKGLT